MEMSGGVQCSRRLHCRAPILECILLDIDRDRVRDLSVNSQPDIDLAASGKTTRQAQVDLIQPDVYSLNAGVGHLLLLATNPDDHSCERSPMVYARPERSQEYLLVCRPDEVFGDEDLLVYEQKLKGSSSIEGVIVFGNREQSRYPVRRLSKKGSTFNIDTVEPPNGARPAIIS